uniref:Uncharacterized protein n=1 Tax=Anopheles merus TaxID=30066 RepID=A0A182VCF2_ANOME
MIQSRTETDGKDMKTPRESKKYITSTAPNTMAGHTGFPTVVPIDPNSCRKMQLWQLLVEVAAPLALLIVGVKGLLLERPCFYQGNPWKGINSLNRRARPVSMMGETAGHNPFNTFPGMEQYGNCIEVHVSLVYVTINITIVCGSGLGVISNEEEPYPSHRRQPHCPVYTSNVKWPIENLVYLEYDVRRFELSSCVPLNETHSYHGHLLLTDDIETRAYLHRAQLPMWRQKLQQPGTVPFQFEGNCSECNFRNEYITLVPRVRLDKDEPPLEAEPYCTDGELGAHKPPLSHITMMLNGATSDLLMKLLIPAAMLFGGVLLFRFCICNKKSTKATVAPMVAHSIHRWLSYENFQTRPQQRTTVAQTLQRVQVTFLQNTCQAHRFHYARELGRKPERYQLRNGEIPRSGSERNAKVNTDQHTGRSFQHDVAQVPIADPEHPARHVHGGQTFGKVHAQPIPSEQPEIGQYRNDVVCAQLQLLLPAALVPPQPVRYLPLQLLDALILPQIFAKLGQKAILVAVATAERELYGQPERTVHDHIRHDLHDRHVLSGVRCTPIETVLARNFDQLRCAAALPTALLRQYRTAIVHRMKRLQRSKPFDKGQCGSVSLPIAPQIVRVQREDIGQ